MKSWARYWHMFHWRSSKSCSIFALSCKLDLWKPNLSMKFHWNNHYWFQFIIVVFCANCHVTKQKGKIQRKNGWIQTFFLYFEIWKLVFCSNRAQYQQIIIKNYCHFILKIRKQSQKNHKKNSISPRFGQKHFTSQISYSNTKNWPLLSRSLQIFVEFGSFYSSFTLKLIDQLMSVFFSKLCFRFSSKHFRPNQSDQKMESLNFCKSFSGVEKRWKKSSDNYNRVCVCVR